ncbi:D-alanyl-D-alanine carboxypeptidase-like protein [Isoptericola sp. CG 20/1183]|uniref:D-alanyl-D-alanine carboxypeptidase-like protein n=1 Tax=Isoptericola halotolerans TaxID=300560 RepID=A0ABX5ELC9_9MICO|nr:MULTISPECIES: M15 family metallopeptidase [Isoptericola]PRZ02485.1 D-alanyl-D-alanine carboxypeptidase-like protein [Isoptericola sp. CG 20/1183]PRZ09949.1 D-alanyl-D-alanine carboxypeptidase-like protein [Isoptericola halotolerans]
MSRARRGRHFAEPPARAPRATRSTGATRSAGPTRSTGAARAARPPRAGRVGAGFALALATASAVVAPAVLPEEANAEGSATTTIDPATLAAAERAVAERSDGAAASRSGTARAPRSVEAIVVDQGAKVSRDGDRIDRDAIKIVPAEPAPAAPDERVPPPGCDPSIDPQGSNGRLSTADLCAPWAGAVLLRADAATALAALNDAYVEQFGERMCITDGYRSYDQQVVLKAQKPGLAAAPGTSNHGWGLAIDICPESYSGDRWAWLAEHGPAAGWTNPAWARQGGAGPYEPWHWEFSPAA